MILRMTKSELVGLVRWDDVGLGHLTLFVPLLSRELPVVLFGGEENGSEVTDKMTATINDVLALPPEDLGRVKELLWEECHFAFQVTDYGVEREEGASSLAAHLREFGISGPDAALDQGEFREIHSRGGFAGRYAAIKVNTGSENSVSIIVKNGRIVDFDDDGTHLGWFDADEQHARLKRKKVLEG